MAKVIHNWDELPVVLNAATVAVILNTTPDHVCALCRAGIIPAKKVSPRLWAIPKDKLIKFIEE